MRKNYFFLIILFVIFASFKASAFNITVNVDDVSRVTLYYCIWVHPSRHFLMATMCLT